MMDSDFKSANFAGWSRKQLAGLGYLIGDSALFANGVIGAMATQDPHKRRDEIGEAVAGLGWAIGGIAMAKYGNRSAEKQVAALEQRLALHFAEQGIELSEALLQKAKAEKDKGFFAKLEDFCYKYPTEILNAIYGGLALLLVKKGYNEYRSLKASGKHNIGINDVSTLGMGVTIVAGALAGLLIKEKSPEQLDEAGAAGIGRWIQEKPMRLTGSLYLANNYFTIQGMIKNKKDFAGHENPLFRNMYLLRGITAGSYIFSNLALLGSSTGADHSAEDAKQQVLESTARIILNQPEAIQEKLLDETVAYLIKQRELGFSRHTPRILTEKLRVELQQYRPVFSAGTETQPIAKPKEEWAERVSDITTPDGPSM